MKVFCYTRCVNVTCIFGVRWTWHWLTEIQLTHTHRGGKFSMLLILLMHWDPHMKLLHKKAPRGVLEKRGKGPLCEGWETAPVHNVQNLPLKTVACRGRLPMRTHQTLYAHFALHSQTLKQRVSEREGLETWEEIIEALPHTAPPFFP